MAAKFTLHITYQGNVRIVNPTNFHKNKFDWSRKVGEIFFRMKYSGSFVFTKNTGDFDFFWDIEKLGNSCDDIYFYVYKCGVLFWKGIFSTGAGKFNLDQCTFEVHPEPYDKYTCFLSSYEKEFNLVALPIPVYSAKTIQGTFHKIVHDYYYDDCNVLTITRCHLDGVLITCPANFNDWCLSDYSLEVTGSCTDGGGNLGNRYHEQHVYTRAELTVPCANPPTGLGWNLLQDNGNGTCTYWRCSSANVVFDKNRKLNSVIEYMADNIGCDISSVESIFLNLNPDEDDPFYDLTAGGTLNYFTGQFSWTNNLMIDQKSNYKMPNASQQATIGITTLKEILEWLNKMFECYWDLTDDGKLIIEHLSYFDDAAKVYSLLSYTKEQEGKNVYEHLNEELPEQEIFEFMENDHQTQSYHDFKGVPIKYSSTCTNTEANVTTVLENLTTNIQYIIDYPDEIDDDGFVIVATEEIGGEFYINYEETLYTHRVKLNGHLSWPNLQYNYLRYNRYLPYGEMNGVQTAFISSRPNLKQSAIEFKWCCGDDNYDFSGSFKTVLGLKYLGNKNGRVYSAEYDIMKEVLKIVFKYSAWQQ